MVSAIIFVLAGIGFMLGTLIYVKNKNKLQGTNPTDKQLMKKAEKKLSNLFGIDGVDNNIITINKNQHSIIVEIESIEYNLLHDEEKESVDRELASIAQMIKLPIQFLEIKQEINIKEHIETIRLNTINANEYVKEYGNKIINHLKHIKEEQNLFERKNYMIISYFGDKKVAKIELNEFYRLLRYHLLNIKVSTRMLNDMEILELVYSQLHKGSRNKLSKMKEKGGLELYVTSKEKAKSI